MYGVPELKELDLIHDELIINSMARMFKRMDIASQPAELARWVEPILRSAMRFSW
jgi:hypothetical protein